MLFNGDDVSSIRNVLQIKLDGLYDWLSNHNIVININKSVFDGVYLKKNIGFRKQYSCVSLIGRNSCWCER